MDAENSDMLDGVDSRLKTLWLWHSAEEAEHKSTAFDLYQALGGGHEWRIKWFRRVTIMFLADTLRQTVSNLRHDGTLWKWSTWKSGASYLFGQRGLIRNAYRPWRDYLRKDFRSVPGGKASFLAAGWPRMRPPSSAVGA